MNENLLRQLSAGAVGNSLIKLVAILLGFLISIILARSLGVEGFGVYSYVMAIIGLLSIPSTLGLPNLVVRLVASYIESESFNLIKGCLKAALISTTIISLSLILIAWYLSKEVFSERFVDGHYELFALSLILLPLYSMVAVVTAALRGLRHVVISQIPEGLLKPIMLLCVIAFLYLFWEGISVIGVMYGNIISAVVMLLFGGIFLWLKLPNNVKVAVPEYNLSSWATSALPLLLSGGMFFINSKMDVLMLGYFKGASDVGIYQVASRAGSLMTVALAIVASIIAPTIARLYTRGDKKKLQYIISISAAASFLITMPLAILLIGFGDSVLLYVFGDEYLSSYTPLAIIAGGYLFSAAMGSSGLILNMTGNERLTFIGVSVAAILNIILNYILIPRMGVDGAALATAMSIIVWNCLLVLFALRIVGVNSTIIGFRFHMLKADW